MRVGPSGPTRGFIVKLPKELGLAGFKGDNPALIGLLNMSGAWRCALQGALGGVRVKAALIFVAA